MSQPQLSLFPSWRPTYRGQKDAKDRKIVARRRVNGGIAFSIARRVLEDRRKERYTIMFYDGSTRDKRELTVLESGSLVGKVAENEESRVENNRNH